ncbi:13602_t:CDS:1, partial [Ambispora gerdemannii]
REIIGKSRIAVAFCTRFKVWKVLGIRIIMANPLSISELIDLCACYKVCSLWEKEADPSELEGRIFYHEEIRPRRNALDTTRKDAMLSDDFAFDFGEVICQY